MTPDALEETQRAKEIRHVIEETLRGMVMPWPSPEDVRKSVCALAHLDLAPDDDWCPPMLSYQAYSLVTPPEKEG